MTPCVYYLLTYYVILLINSISAPVSFIFIVAFIGCLPLQFKVSINKYKANKQCRLRSWTLLFIAIGSSKGGLVSSESHGQNTPFIAVLYRTVCPFCSLPYFCLSSFEFMTMRLSELAFILKQSELFRIDFQCNFFFWQVFPSCFSLANKNYIPLRSLCWERSSVFRNLSYVINRMSH